MSHEPESFDALRRLIALKHHEQPPPGYFQHFSDQVILRIRNGERGAEATFLGRLFEGAPWLERLCTGFTTSPTLAGAFGLALCGLLVAGVVYSSNSGPVNPQDALRELTSDAPAGLQLVNQSSGFVSSTNGVLPQQAMPSLFDEFHGQVTPTLVKAQAQ